MLEPIACPVCATSFVPRSRRQKYCQLRCARIAANRAHWARFRREGRGGYCSYCNAPIAKGAHEFCSHSCATKSRVVPLEVDGVAVHHCSRCGEPKPLNLFPTSVQHARGVTTVCKACRARYMREYLAANPEAKRRNRLRKYGLTPQEYDRMLEAQRGRCGICGSAEPGGQYGVFSVDHRHDTKQVRELLCSSCNFLLGNAREAPWILRQAADYLERHE